MAEIILRAGASIDIPSRDEISSDLNGILDQRFRDWARGVKWMRLPVMYGQASGNTLSLNPQTTGVTIGPEQGYLWTLRRVVIDGMTTGGTPDIVNLYRNGHTGQAPLWQFNGNNFGYAFRNFEMVLVGGDFLEVSSAGVQSFAATGTIRMSGELLEVPAEMAWKLLGQ